MDRRHSQYLQGEQAVLARLTRHPSALPARVLALELGWPWRVVARALARLAAAGSARRIEVTSRDSRYRPRVQTTYQAVAPAHLTGVLPSWLVPQVHPVTGGRLVVGRATLGG